MTGDFGAPPEVFPEAEAALGVGERDLCLRTTSGACPSFLKLGFQSLLPRCPSLGRIGGRLSGLESSFRSVVFSFLDLSTCRLLLSSRESEGDLRRLRPFRPRSLRFSWRNSFPGIPRRNLPGWKAPPSSPVWLGIRSMALRHLLWLLSPRRHPPHLLSYRRRWISRVLTRPKLHSQPPNQRGQLLAQILELGSGQSPIRRQANQLERAAANPAERRLLFRGPPTTTTTGGPLHLRTAVL